MHVIKLPGGEYINLALVQRVQVDEERPTIVVYWQNAHMVYQCEDAQAVIQTLDAIAFTHIPRNEKSRQN